MPVFVPALIALGLGALTSTGVKRACKGLAAMQRAQEVIEDAERCHELCRQRHVTWMEGTRQRSEDLDRLEIAVMTSFRRLAGLHERLRQRATLEPIPHAGGLAEGPPSRLSGAALPAGGGGAAVAAPGGAAAMNAKLAWLGGGALAARGLGMARGAMVWRGLALAPVVAIAGFALDARGEERLEAAYAYAAQLEAASARMDEDTYALQGVCARVDELQRVAGALHERLQTSLDALEALGGCFDAGREDLRAQLSVALQQARALAEVLGMPCFPEHDDPPGAAAAMRLRAAIDQGSAHNEGGV